MTKSGTRSHSQNWHRVLSCEMNLMNSNSDIKLIQDRYLVQNQGFIKQLLNSFM